jgi:hypothetical protein
MATNLSLKTKVSQRRKKKLLRDQENPRHRPRLRNPRSTVINSKLILILMKIRV